MHIYYTLVALMAANGFVYSQNSLSGNVTDSQNRPLEGTHIHIGALHAESLPDGSYLLPDIPAGNQRVIASYIGFYALDTIININGTTVMDIKLKPKVTQLEEVVLTESVVANNATGSQKLKTETLEKYSGATLGDALREIAGVSSLRTGSTIVKPVINGLHSSRVPIFTNGVRLEDQQWGTEHAPNLDVNAAGKVSVIKGAAGLQYSGDAVGGLVIVEPPSILKDTLMGKTILTADSNGRGGSLATTLSKGAEKGWAWNAQGTFKYYGDRETPGYVLSNTGNREGNFSGDVKYLADRYTLGASYSFYNATVGIAQATHIGNVADLVRAINNREPSVVRPFTYTIGVPRQEVQHHIGKVNYLRNLSDDETLSLQYAFQLNRRKEFDLRRGALEDVAALDLTLATHSANADWKKLSGNNTYTAGISGAYQHNNASPETGIRPLIPNYNKTDAGAYGIFTRRFSNTLTAEAGVRYDFSHVDASKYYQVSRWNDLGYNDGSLDHIIVEDLGSQYLTNPKFTYHNTSASAGVRKQLAAGLDLLGNLGLAMRNPNPGELFSDGLHHSNATIELGSLRTKKERSVKASATLIKTEGDVTFEATPYINAIHDFIYLQPTGVEYTIRGSFPVYRYRQANALMAGTDVHVGYNFSQNFSYSFNGAYVYGQNTSDNIALIDMPPLNLAHTVRYTLSQWHGFFAEIRSESVFTQQRYPDYNFYADVPQNGVIVPTYVNISTPPKGYSLLHFSTGTQFSVGKNSLGIHLSVYNVLNTSYRDYLNRQRLYTDEVGRNIQLQLKFSY
ncbi:TonB-dependent receptor [Flavobacterium sp. RHBU_24]|uniref:TonB-dependent receptor n=1 Tax=Flavobacterium sp. RHBU_24 TaxID=3391185 RepID=UPI00398522AD